MKFFKVVAIDEENFVKNSDCSDYYLHCAYCHSVVNNVGYVAVNDDEEILKLSSGFYNQLKINKG